MRHKTITLTIAFSIFLAVSSTATATVVSIKLTADALGLGTDDVNKGGTVDPDIVGKLITSSTTGVGSILTIQTDGKAGPGTALAPLFVTVTAETHLDTVSGLPSPNDYLAGVIYITKEHADLPDGRKEGLGVRAFKVDPTTGLRLFDGGQAQLERIEGSKHVSGGTGPTAYDSSDPNGAPHVDEHVKFDFNNPAHIVSAQSVEVLLSDYDPTDIIDLHIELISGGSIDLIFMQTTDTNGGGDAIFEEIGDKLWKLKFAPLDQLSAGDKVDYFTIRANDDDPQDPRGTAEHFFITGITAVPEPATMGLLGLGTIAMLRRRRI